MPKLSVRGGQRPGVLRLRRSRRRSIRRRRPLSLIPTFDDHGVKPDALPGLYYSPSALFHLPSAQTGLNGIAVGPDSPTTNSPSTVYSAVPLQYCHHPASQLDESCLPITMSSSTSYGYDVGLTCDSRLHIRKLIVNCGFSS